MALSRRPARFIRRPDSMQTKTISQDQLELLRAVAARVYINEQNPEDKSSEVNKPLATGSANVKAEAGFANGVELLALAATEIGATGAKKEGSLKKEQ